MVTALRRSLENTNLTPSHRVRILQHLDRYAELREILPASEGLRSQARSFAGQILLPTWGFGTGIPTRTIQDRIEQAEGFLELADQVSRGWNITEPQTPEPILMRLKSKTLRNLIKTSFLKPKILPGNNEEEQRQNRRQEARLIAYAVEIARELRWETPDSLKPLQALESLLTLDPRKSSTYGGMTLQEKAEEARFICKQLELARDVSGDIIKQLRCHQPNHRAYLVLKGSLARLHAQFRITHIAILQDQNSPTNQNRVEAA
jgi:hypothetical protein